MRCPACGNEIYEYELDDCDNPCNFNCPYCGAYED